MYPATMRDFRHRLCLKYERSGMPAGLNGPQVDKVWRNLGLLQEMIGGTAIGDGSVVYLEKLQNLYKMCVRYLFSFFAWSKNFTNYITARNCLATMPASSRNSDTILTICILWSF